MRHDAFATDSVVCCLVNRLQLSCDGMRGKMKNIKAVIFDLDNTLTDRDLAFYQFCEYLIDGYRDKFPYQGKREDLLDFMMKIDQGGYGGIENFLREIKKEWGFTMEYEQFLEERVRVFGKLTVAKEDADDVLTYIRAKYRTGIITNGSSTMQREKLKYANIEEYFDDVLVSGEFGEPKPCTDIFYQSLNNLGIKPEEAVYVGDYYLNDIEPSLKIGMKPIWLTKDRTKFPEYKGICISSLSDLKQIL